jgi:DNA-directed RNA polymerase specialized sigma24 family protein
MQYLKVFDQISNLERTVTQKAYDIINKNKRIPRYKLLAYIDEDGEVTEAAVPVQQVAVEKKVEQVEKVVEPVAAKKEIVTKTPAEGVTVIRKSKPKTNAKK